MFSFPINHCVVSWLPCLFSSNMKSINDHNSSNAAADDRNNHHHNTNNWLGFSLSPHMKMDVSASHQQEAQPSSSAAATTVPTAFYLSPSHFSNCYGGVAENNANFHSPLTVMPLKSDGSLCVMEALGRSQTQVMVPISSPKLEDFLGGATHQYVSHHKEAMALSLDSMHYNTQNANTQPNRDHSLPLLSEPFTQHTYYSALACHGLYQAPLQEQTKETTVQMLQIEEDNACLKNWGNQREYSSAATHQGNLEQQMNCVGGCGELQSLSLSMSPGSQSSCVTAPPPRQISLSGTDSVVVVDAKKRGSAKLGGGGQKQPVHRKSIDTFGQRTSQYRGVTRHRWTGRYEAHLWDNSCKKEGQTRKGRQVYLGGYDMEEKAARAYDMAALKYWGASTHINFPLENYQTQLEEMKNMTRQEYVAHLRRKSSGFSRGASMYRGVTRHHQHGRWQARIGRVAGNKDLYLGTFRTQEEAAEAYDVAAIKFRGVNAVTNFDISRYDVERIMASNTLLNGETARRNKDSDPRKEAIEYNSGNNISNQNNVEAAVQARNNKEKNDSEWNMALYNHPQQQSNNQKTLNCESKKNSAFCTALQGLLGIDSGGSGQGQPMIDDESCNKIGNHFSNPSSLVTSISSSREASPDKTIPSMLFPKPSSRETKIVNPFANNGVSSWFPSTVVAAAQLRPAAAMNLSHLPDFAAWNDT